MMQNEGKVDVAERERRLTAREAAAHKNGAHQLTPGQMPGGGTGE